MASESNNVEPVDVGRTAMTKEQAVGAVKDLLPEALASRYSRDCGVYLARLQSKLDFAEPAKYTDFANALTIMAPKNIQDLRGINKFFQFVDGLAASQEPYANLTGCYQHFVKILPDFEHADFSCFLVMSAGNFRKSNKYFSLLRKYDGSIDRLENLQHLMNYLFGAICNPKIYEKTLDTLLDITGLDALQIVEPLLEIMRYESPEVQAQVCENIINEIIDLKSRTNGSSKECYKLLQVFKIADQSLYPKFNKFTADICEGIAREHVAGVIACLAISFEKLIEENKVDNFYNIAKRFVGTSNKVGLINQSKLHRCFDSLLTNVPFDRYTDCFADACFDLVNRISESNNLYPDSINFFEDLSRVPDARLSKTFIDCCLRMSCELAIPMGNSIYYLSRIPEGSEAELLAVVTEILPRIFVRDAFQLVSCFLVIPPTLWLNFRDYLLQYPDYFNVVYAGEDLMQELKRANFHSAEQLVNRLSDLYRQYYNPERNYRSNNMRSIAHEVHRFAQRIVPDVSVGRDVTTTEVAMPSKRTFNNEVLDIIEKKIIAHDKVKLSYAEAISKISRGYTELKGELRKPDGSLPNYLSDELLELIESENKTDADQNILATVVTYVPDDHLKTWLQNYFSESKQAYDSNKGGKSCLKGVKERAITTLRYITQHMPDQELKALFHWAEKVEASERKIEMVSSQGKEWTDFIVGKLQEKSINDKSTVESAFDVFKEVIVDFFADVRVPETDKSITPIIDLYTQIDPDTGKPDAFEQFWEKSLLPSLQSQLS